MEYEELKTGHKIPKLGLGTYQIDLAPRNDAIEALRRGIELEMTLIDTAEMYGWGKAEEIVGEAIKPFEREKLTIVSKVWGTNLAYNKVKKSAEASARRLGTYIDIYLIHWPNPAIPLRETMKAMEELVLEGIIRYIGVSNFPLKLLEKAIRSLDREDVVVDQVEYNLWVRDPEINLLPYCQKEKIVLMAYSPLDKGRLAREPSYELKVVADKLGKTPAQVALNWLISKPMVVAIPKAARLNHVEEIAGSIGWRIPEDLMEILNRE